MPKDFRQVNEEYERFKYSNPKEDISLADFAKEMDAAQGTPGERQAAYRFTTLKKIDSAIDQVFEVTQLPQITGGVAGELGRGLDALVGTNVAPTVEAVGRDLPRMTTEALATIGSGGATLPLWASRLGKVAGYGSAALGGTADTDSVLGGAVSAGSLALGNKLLLPKQLGGVDVGAKAERATQRALDKAAPDIVAETGKNVLTPRPELTPATIMQRYLPFAARVGADVGTGAALNEATRQAHLSVGPNAVGPLDPQRNPLTPENIAANVVGAGMYAPAAIAAGMNRPRLVPKQVEQLHKWIENRKAAEEAYLGYEWEGPIDPRTYHDTFGTTKGSPAFKGDDLVPVEDYWSEFVPKDLPTDPASNEAKTQKLATVLRTTLQAYKDQKARGDDPFWETTSRRSIEAILNNPKEFVGASPTQLAQAAKELDAIARQMPPEDLKGLAAFKRDFNLLADDFNDTKIRAMEVAEKELPALPQVISNEKQLKTWREVRKIRDELKAEKEAFEKAKGTTWHPNAVSAVKIKQLQAKGLLPELTEADLKRDFQAEFDQSGDPQFAYQVVLQKYANMVFDKVPELLELEKSLPTQAVTEPSPGVLKAQAKNDAFVDALNAMPDEVRDAVIARTAEILQNPSQIAQHGKLKGRLVDRVGSWRNAIITAAQTYDPEAKTIMRRKMGGGFEKASINELVMRGDDGEYLWNPVFSAVPIGEGGKPKSTFKGKQLPETNIEDLAKGQEGIAEDVPDDIEEVKSVLAEQGMGGSLQAKETAGLGEGKAGEERVPETPDYLQTPMGKATAEALTLKKDELLKTLKSLSDDQLYNVSRDAFITRSSVGLPIKDPYESQRRPLFRPALEAALEDLQNKGEKLGPAGLRFLAAWQESGRKLVGNGQRMQLAQALRDFFKFKTPVEGGPQGVPPHYQRIGQIVNFLLDPKRVEAHRRAKMSPGEQMMTEDEIRAKIGDDVDPNAVVSENGKPVIFYHGTKHARGVDLMPSKTYKTTSLSTVPEVANSFGSLSTYPLLVKSGRFFDYKDPKDLERLFSSAQFQGNKENIKNGNWLQIENNTNLIKDLGWDGFWTIEGYSSGNKNGMYPDVRNLHVFEPKKSLVYLPDTVYLKKPAPASDIFVNTQPPGSFTKDVARTIRFHMSNIFGQAGYSGTMRDLYTDMATALALQLDNIPVDFYSIQGREWGLAMPKDGRGKLGLQFQLNEGESATRFANRIIATLAHEISHIDEWVLNGAIPKPDAFSEQRRRHLENIHSLAKVLSQDEREAIIMTLRDGLVPERYQYDIKDPETNRVYGSHEPTEFVATVNELLAASLLGGKSGGKILSALEVLDYGPAEVREYARGTYRTIHDTLLGMKESITNPMARAEAGKQSLPNVNLFVTSEAFHAAVNAAREGSLLRESDKLLAQARAMTASMSQGAATAIPLPSPAQWFRQAKEIKDVFKDATPGPFDGAKAMPSESAVSAVEEAGKLLSGSRYDKTQSPSVWARWFYPFANLMRSMERSGVTLAWPTWQLAENLETGISRTRSRIIQPFLKRGKDGRLHYDDEQVLIKKISEEKTGPWRTAVNEISAWQQDQGAQSMFVVGPEGQVTVNPQLKGAQEKWDQIRSKLTPADQQIVQASTIAMDRVSQNAAEELVVSIDKSVRHRTAQMFMALNRGMLYEQAMALADQTVGTILSGNHLALPSILSPTNLKAIQTLLLGEGGLIAKFDEVKQKLLNRPGFRTESLPGDYIVRFRTPEGTVRYLSADTKTKAAALEKKLTEEGNFPEGEIVHKDELRDYTDVDAPDTILQKFIEVEGAVWDRFVTEMESVHGSEVATSLKEFTPGSKLIKELGTKGIQKFLTERKRMVDATRYDYIDGQMTWAGRLATSIAFRETRQILDLILSDPRARMFPTFQKLTKEHFAELMNPTSQLSKEMKSFTTAYMLGVSLSSAIVEASQSATTLVPQLIALEKKGGPVKAYHRLFSAIGDATWVTMSNEWQSVAKNAKGKSPESLTRRETLALAYERAIEDGGINHGVIEDLIYGRDQKMLTTAKFGHGDYGPVTKAELARNAVYIGSQFAMKVYSWMSIFNNKISFLAGAGQAFDQGLRGDRLYDHAKLVKTLSTFGGGKANVPGLVPKLSTPYTRSAVGLVNTLQQYGYGTVATYAQLVKDSLGKSAALDVGQRRQAQKAFGTMLATQVALGGALGLPFAAASLTMLEKVFGVPANELVRQGLASLGSDEDQGAVIAETALNGIGNQMFGIDVSSRMGVNSLLGTSAYRGFNLQDMLGPSASIVENMLMGLNWFGQNEPMKAMKALVPNSVKTLVEMTDTKAKYGDYGIRDAGDNLLYSPTPSQAAMYMIGFRPRELSQKRQAQKVLTFANERASRQRDAKLDSAAEGLLSGRPEDSLKLAQEAQFADITVDPRSILRSVVQRAVDSTTERDLLSSGPTSNEKQRQAIASTFGRGVVNRQSELQRSQLSAQLGAQLGLQPDTRTFQRAALVDALVQQRGMPRSQAIRLVEFLQ